MADAIISRLTSLGNLAVRPTSEVLKYAKAPADLAQVARELEVESVLNGTYQRVGDIVRVSVQLIDPKTRVSRWARRYDLRADDMLTFQDEVAQQVVKGLSLKMTEAERSDLGAPLTNSPEAYNLYLEGAALPLELSGRSQAEVLRNTRRLLEQAVVKDPNFAKAYARLGYAYAASYAHEGPDDGMKPQETLDRALEVAQRALRLNPRLADAYEALGFIFLAQGRPEESIPNLRRAIALAPNAGSSWFLLGQNYHDCGLLVQAEKAFGRSVDLSPTYLVSLCWQSQMLLWLGRAPESELKLRRCLQANPDAALVMSFLGEVLYYQGRLREAEPFLSRAAALWWPAGASNPLWYDPVDFAAYLYASQGRREVIDFRFFSLKPEEVRNPVHMYRKASVYALLGERDTALKWFRRTVEMGNRNYPWFERDKNLDKLRPDPEFQRILAEARVHWERYKQIFGAE
jgi:adenylate cyclase